MVLVNSDAAAAAKPLQDLLWICDTSRTLPAMASSVSFVQPPPDAVLECEHCGANSKLSGHGTTVSASND